MVAKSQLAIRAMLNQLALAAFSGYRRFVSPYKGFRCAYGAIHHRGSCSDVGLRITRRFGARRMLQLLPLQAARCRAAFVLSQSPGPTRRGRKDEGPKGTPANGCLGDLALQTGCIACCPWP